MALKMSCRISADSFLYSIFNISVYFYNFILFYIYYYFFIYKPRLLGGSRCSSDLGGGGEVGGHETLQVEVSQLITVLQLEKLLQLGIGKNAATIVLVLELVVADVSVDLASNLGPGHLGTVGLAEKSGKLVGNEGGLDKAGRLAIDVLTTLLLGGLAGGAQLALNLTLNAAKLGAKRCKSRHEGLQLGVRCGE